MPWVLDKVHSNVGFSVRHMMVSKVKGRFGDFDATIHLDEEQPERSSVEARIQVASVDTRDAQRDGHLRSPDFFDAENFPELLFVSGRVERLPGDGKFRLVGDLTMHGHTHEVVLEGEYEGPHKDMQGHRRLGFELKGKIEREEFDLTYNMALDAGGFMLSKDIEVSIDCEVLEQ